MKDVRRSPGPALIDLARVSSFTSTTDSKLSRMLRRETCDTDAKHDAKISCRWGDRSTMFILFVTASTNMNIEQQLAELKTAMKTLTGAMKTLTGDHALLAAEQETLALDKHNIPIWLKFMLLAVCVVSLVAIIVAFANKG